MIRIRLGDSWKHDAACVRDLQRLAEDQKTGLSPRALVDAIRIEVDGVDLTRGRAEASLVDALAALRAAARRSGTHAIPFGAVTLHIESAGEDLRLRLASSHGDVHATVEPARFAEAVWQSHAEFAESLKAIHPALADQKLWSRSPPRPRKRKKTEVKPSEKKLRTLAARPARLSLPTDGLRRLIFRRLWRDSLPPGTVGHPWGKGWLFRSERLVEARSISGERLWEATLSQATVLPGRAPRLLARDEQGAVVQLTESGRVLRRQDAAIGGHLLAWHGETIVSTRGVDVGGRVLDLDVRAAEPVGERLVVTTPRKVLCLDGDGAVRWSFEALSPSVCSLPGERQAVVEHDHVTCLDLQSGSELWQRTLHRREAHSAVRCGADLCVGAEASGRAVLIRLDGREGTIRWEHRLTGEGPARPVASFGRTWIARLGAGLVCLDSTGREVAHLPPLDAQTELSPAQAPPLLIAGRLGLLAGTHLHVVDLHHAHALATIEGLELSPSSASLLPSGHLAVTASDGEVEGWSPSGYLRLPTPASPRAIRSRR